MEIKDIIEKLEEDLRFNKKYMPQFEHYAIRYFYIYDLLKWIKIKGGNNQRLDAKCQDKIVISPLKSNLEKEQAKYSKDYDDWRESKIAEERENQG